MDLHDVAERMIAMSKDGPLNMDDYDSIVAGTELVPVGEVSKKTKDSYMDKASAEIDQHWDKSHVDADAARKYYNRKNTMRKINNEDAAMPANHAEIAKKVHKELAAGEQVSAAYGAKIKSAHDMLQKKYGKDWRKKAGITENLGYGYNPAANTVDRTDVNFSQTKQMGDATVTVSANAKSMDELQRVLKLAGLEVTPVKSYAEPTVEPTPTQPAEEVPCGCDEPAAEPSYDNDVKYSTDKQTLINVLRDKLQKSIG
jgi:hypothetical protein